MSSARVSAILASVVAGLLIRLPPGWDPTRKTVRPGRGSAAAEATPTPAPPSPPLSAAEIDQFVAAWPVFERALAAIGTASAPVASDAPADSAPEAGRATEADARLRRALAEGGTDPDAFLALYRRVSAAWWAMIQQDDRAAADAALEAETAGLERVAGSDPAAGEAATEMRRTGDAFDRRIAARPSDVPPESIEMVRKNRDRLTPIFEE